jgi:crotonobetainyl-CoA:carnitine CoA-transferase CaiB-like acyl-CoA transferase
MARPALDGITIVDLSRHMAGPYATLVMGDFGANVIKVESIPDGDPSRQNGTVFTAGESAMFLVWNRSKRSIALDLRKPEGLAILRRLIAKADILIENYRPGIAEKMGIGWEAVHTLNPRLIYVSVSAYGSAGSWKDRPGTDPAVQAASGVMSVTGERDGGPLLAGTPVADYTASMQAVQAMLLGLIARGTTGEGQHVETSMLAGLLFGLTTRVAPYFLNGQNPVRWGSQHSQVVPYQAFATADGYVVAGVWEDRGWPAFCEALGIPELSADPRFANNVERAKRRDELTEILQRAFRTRPTDEWDPRFAKAGSLFSPINSFSDILESEQVRSNEMTLEVEHPAAGRLRQVAPPIKMSATPADVRLPPPMYGQHSRAILRELGMTEDEIAQHARDGIISIDDSLEVTA